MIVVDTGPLVAAALSNDDHHHECVELFTSAHLAGTKLLVPPPIITEVCYLLEREAGSHVEADFLRSMGDEDFSLVELTLEDLHRMADLVDIYDDLPLGGADASVVTVAERFEIPEVATLNRRDFHVVRPSYVEALTLLP